MALIPPHFLNCVVGIGFGTEENHPYVATGFLIGKYVGKTKPVYTGGLVTNRHVVEGESRAWLRFNPKGKEPARELLLEFTDQNGHSLFTMSEQYDLAVAAIRIDQLEEQGIEFGAFRDNEDILTLAAAEEAGLSEGDGVFALGFPMGLIGEHRNYVIVRQGAIARVRDAYHGASDEILVDITIFPGNSGGPVVTRPELLQIRGTKSVARAALIGVVSSYLPYEDIAVSLQTNRPRVIFQENSGLASVVPIEHALALFEENLREWERRGVATAGVPAE